MPYIVTINSSTGVVQVNGADARNPGIPLTWNWGDGTTTQGFFAQSHTYSNVLQNYILQVVSHENDGSTDCAQINVVFGLGQPVASAPTVTSLSPPSTVVGATGQTLTVIGTNFLATSTVTYNGAAHAATFVSSTQLMISLSPGDQATVGVIPVVVTNPPPNGVSSSPVYFLVLKPSSTPTIILSLATGNLNVGSTNNEFLLEFRLNGNGLATPYPAFFSSTTFLTGNQNTSYLQSTNPSFIFDFSFSVSALATISVNPKYLTYVGSTASSVTLLQGTNVVAAGVQTETLPVVGTVYSIPSVILQPNTQYDLLVTTLGPSSYDQGVSETQGWGQISLDVSAAAPAATPPGPVTVFSPAQGAIGVSLTPFLTWTAAAGASSYDIYFGTSPSPPFVTNTTGTSYGPVVLNPNTTYYWYLVSKNALGSTFSAIWSFTTWPSLPTINSGGVVSASSFGQFTSIAPGSWIEIYGTNLAADSRQWTGADFNGVNAPTSLDGTTVTIGGQSAFIDYISPTQVNAQVPSNAGTGPQPVIVNTAAGASAAVTVMVNQEEPGLLARPSFKIGGTQYVVALFSDGATYVLPPEAISGVTSRRAQPGDVITLYGIGFGSVTPNIPAGQTVQQLNTLAAPFHILFGQTEASVQYDGLAPDAVGLYQFNVVVPNVAPSDTVPLTFTLGGVAGTQTLYIAVQN